MAKTKKPTKKPAHSAKRGGTRAEQAAQKAMALLEVDPVAVRALPKITHLFNHIGGMLKVWEVLGASELPEARKLVALCDRLTAEQRDSVPFEAIILAAGFMPKHVFGIVSEAVLEHSDETAQLILNASLPDVVAATVQRAKAFDGTADAKMLMQSKKFVPVPKGSVTIVKGDMVGGNKNTFAVLPQPEDTGRRLNDRFNLEISTPIVAIEAAHDEPEYYDEDDSDE